MNEPRHFSRAGFTLVELLMVILIIAMLIALLLPAVQAARLRGLEASISSQIEQLVNGIDGFKSTYGAYPPSMVANTNVPYWSDQEVLTFLRQTWPKATFTANDVRIIQSLDAAESLVFWLGGIFDGTRMAGFSSDPRNPLAGPDAAHDPFGKWPLPQPPARTQPFPFDETRIFDKEASDGNADRGNRFPEYYPPNTRPQDSGAFVYFAARPGKTYCMSPPPPNNTQIPRYMDPRGVAQGVAVPYQMKSAQSGVKRFVKEDSFQIICAGVDVNYGGAAPDRVYPEGVSYGPGDVDNLTSFYGRRLGDAQP